MLCEQCMNTKGRVNVVLAGKVNHKLKLKREK